MEMPLLAKAGIVIAAFTVFRGWPCARAAFFTAPKRIRDLKAGADTQLTEQWEAYRKKMSDRFWWFMLFFVLECIGIGMIYLGRWLETFPGVHVS